MDAGALIALTTSLVVGLTAGFFMHRSDFCLAGAFRDVFLFRSTKMIRVLVLLVVVSAVLFESTRMLGWLPYYPFPIFSQASLINLCGGMLFGIGMVLAGGCVVGVLYKMGGGSVLAGIALLGLFAGSALYAEFHLWWVRLGKSTRLHEQAITLPQLTGTDPIWWVAVLVLIGGGFCWLWRRDWILLRGTQVEGYVPPWITALVLAVLGLVSALGTGMPMGVTTSYAKAAAFVEQLVAPEHVASLKYFTTPSLHYRLPFGTDVLASGAAPVFDVLALIQVPLIFGIVLGALASALLLREFRPRWQLPGRQVLMVFVGGIIMALGSRMAQGCNIWHLLGGLPLFTMQSLLFLAGLLPGAWLGAMMLRRMVAA